MPIVDAVTFDYWDTLLGEEARGMRLRQIDGFQAALEAAGYAVDRRSLAAAFRENWAAFERAWEVNRGPYTPGDSSRFICEVLGVPLLDGLLDRLVDAFREAGEVTPLRVADGIDGCLDVLRAAGIGVGLVCDVGMTTAPTLRKRLAEVHLLDRFDVLAFSDESGWFKPSAEAWRPALEALGVSPARAAHVGDNRRTDVAGARALGMLSVRYTGFKDQPPGPGPEADHVIAHHRELPGLLSVG